MNSHSDSTSIGDLIDTAANGMIGLGMLTMVLAPFAVPGILLTIGLALPLLLAGLVVGLLGAAVVALVGAVAAVARKVAGRLRPPAGPQGERAGGRPVRAVARHTTLAG